MLSDSLGHESTHLLCFLDLIIGELAWSVVLETRG